MLTVRIVPPRLWGGTEDEPPQADLAAFYFGRLRQNWSLLDRALAFALARAAALVNMRAIGAGAAWANGWDGEEQSLVLGTGDHRGHLSMAVRKGVHRLINPGAFPLDRNPLKNKRLFARLCLTAGLSAPNSFEGPRERLANWLRGESAVIAKPNYASKGQGIVGFRRDGEGWLVDGEPLDDREALRRLDRIFRSGGVIQRICDTHPALVDLSPSALPTLRIMTALDEQGRVEVCDRMIRLSAGGPRAVDNFNAGNIVAGLDPAGRIVSAYRRSAGEIVAVDRHPHSGSQLAGRAAPDLQSAVELAAAAHEAVRDGFAVIGWDIGVTADGPCLIEGNWNPGTDVVALVSGQDLGETRLGALYRHHLSRRTRAEWRAARPVEREPGRRSRFG